VNREGNRSENIKQAGLTYDRDQGHSQISAAGIAEKALTPVSRTCITHQGVSILSKRKVMK
jgi:hypothetical protein